MTQRAYSFIGSAVLLLATACSEGAAPTGAAGASVASGTAGSGGGTSNSVGSGGSGAGGAAAGAGGSGTAGAAGSSTGGSDDAGRGGSSGGGGSSGAGAGGSSGRGGSSGGGGSAGMRDAGSTGTGGGDGATLMRDGGPDGSATDASDARTTDDDGSTTLFPCLLPGEEKLIIEVAGTPSLNIMTPSEMTCLSRYLPEGNGSEALFDLQWSVASTALFVVVRSSQVVPGQLGTFTPFSVLLATGAEAWTSLGAQCRVTVTSSTKIGEMPRGGGAVEDSYKVVGSMTCSAGWAGPSKPGADLRRFEFATRATFLRTL